MSAENIALLVAREWIATWNSHDIEAILEHYDDEVVFSSPFVVQMLGEPTGTLRGKDRLRYYCAKGLEAYPDLHFDLLDVLTGVNSLVVYYRSVGNRLAAEVMQMNPAGRISHVMAHYRGES